LIFEYLSTNTGIPMKNLNKKQLVVALLAAGVVGAAHADYNISTNANVGIQGNNDGSGINEGVFISSNLAGPSAPANAAGAYFVTNGNAGIYGSQTAVTGANYVTINTTGPGWTSIGNTSNTTTITGTTNTINGITNNINGTTNNITGTTTNVQSGNVNINTQITGGGNTSIGVGTNALTMNGATTINYSNNANTSINAGTSTGAVLIGNSGMSTTNTVTAVSGNSNMTLTNSTASLGTANSSYTTSYAYPGGYQGTNNGVTSTATNTNVTGGTSNLLLGNNGATFSNVNNGAPIQVHGVADGTNNFDAVNVRQLNAIKMGIAGAVAMSNIPTLDAGKNFGLGVGLGGFDSQTSVALGASARVTDSLAVRASVGHSFASNNSNIRVTTWGVGAALGW
jgi:hypothetical protein